ncbi:MAG: hypothetical protein KAV82_06375 [Phycisphaerae bacterium]|nr:hypothetical protein [Phycisphaerae bacterium]
MRTTLKWSPAALRQHAGECFLLGQGDVALVYELCDAGRVRVAFYLFRHGSFRLCVVDTGSVQALLSILSRYENTDAFLRRYCLPPAADQPGGKTAGDKTTRPALSKLM